MCRRQDSALDFSISPDKARAFDTVAGLRIPKPIPYLQPLETLPEEERALIEEMRSEAVGREMGEGAGDDGALMLMSTMNDEGVVDVKNAACERLLQVRRKMRFLGSVWAGVLCLRVVKARE